MKIPEALARFLAEMPDDDANDLWEWLDGDPEAVEKMIEVISENHERLNMLTGGGPETSKPL